jgi:hypothetical protein
MEFSALHKVIKLFVAEAYLRKLVREQCSRNATVRRQAAPTLKSSSK